MNFEIKPSQRASGAVNRRPVKASADVCPRTRKRHNWNWTIIKSTVPVWYRIERQVCAACPQTRERIVRTSCNTCGAVLSGDEHGIPTVRWCGCCQAGREYHESIPRADI